MLYLIGGPPRIGKSTLSQKLLHEQKLPYVSTDALTVMLEPIGQTTFYNPEKAARFYPILELFIKRMLTSSPDYVIEGDAFSPYHADALSQKYDLRAVFLIMSKVSADNILQFAQFDNWAGSDTPSQLDDLVTRITEASVTIRQECEHYGIPCFDMSVDYAESFKQAYDSLLR